jgi:hypothetical protein
MKTKLLVGLAVALLAGGSAFAHDGRGGGGSGGRAVAFSGGGRAGGFESRGAGGSFRSPSIAFGGSSSRAFSNGRGGGGRFAFSSHSGWNRGNAYFWNGRHYRYYNNGWFIVDPYPYYGGGYYGSDYYGPGYTVYGQSSDDDSAQPSAPVSLPAQVQQELAREGYYRGPIDGLVGPGTRSAISAYQQDNGLRVTGTINGHLLDALDLH